MLLKTAFSQTSIHSQSLVRILWRSDKDNIIFKTIEKHRYGLRKTISKHLNRPLEKKLGNAKVESLINTKVPIFKRF